MDVDKKRYPYLFLLTEKGMKYGEHIALNHQRYKLDIDQYYIPIVKIKRTKHPLYYKNDLTSYEEVNYFESLLDALTTESSNDQEVYSGKREEDDHSIPFYLLDEKLDEIKKMKEKYCWDEMEFYRVLLQTNIKYKGPINKKRQMI